MAFNADLHKVAKSRIDEVIALTGLTPESHKKIGELSKGYRQRVGSLMLLTILALFNDISRLFLR